MPIDYTKKPSQPGVAPASPSLPAAAPVSLSKVTLTKAAPSVSLTKHDSGGLLRVNLNWQARPAGAAHGGGFLKRLAAPQSNIDLDLGCLYEFSDGSKGVVQALGNAFAASPRGVAEPIIRLDGDDRSGNNSGGENLFINLAYVPQIRRIMVFALIYEGVPNWAAADAVVTLFPVAGPQIEVRLDEGQNGARICGIALLENTGGQLAVRREVNYINGSQSALDRAYNWGMNWTQARK